MGLFKSIGKITNDLMGSTSASKQAYNQQLALNNMSYQQQKEFAQNAYQWSAEDAKKAGFNPYIAMNGSTASSIADGGKTSGTGFEGHGNGINPIQAIMGMMEYQQNKEANTANTELTKQKTLLTQQQTIRAALENENLPAQQKAILEKTLKNIDLIVAKTGESYANSAYKNALTNEIKDTNFNNTIDEVTDTLFDNKKNWKEKAKAVGKGIAGIFIK